MARYFLHLNPNDPDFQKVTELQAIDDSDPTFVLYYFKDGSKCNKDFIGQINDTDVYGKKELTEVYSPTDVWEFKITEVKDAEPQFAINAAGERVEIPNMHMYTKPDEAPIKKGKKVDIVKQPTHVPDSVLEKRLNEKVSPNTEHKTFDFNVTTKEVENNEPTQISLSTITKNEPLVLNADNLITSNTLIQFMHNGHHYSMNARDFFNNAITPMEEKVVEKVVERVVEVPKQVPVSEDTHIEIGIDDTQKGLVDNMIDMSQKEECDIAMEITLTLPPISVYQLIKSVYPTGMAKGFVNIIADRMQIKELKKAVANGLLAYYDEDATIEVEREESNNEIIESEKVDTQKEEKQVVQKRKAGRPKKDNK